MNDEFESNFVTCKLFFANKTICYENVINY